MTRDLQTARPNWPATSWASPTARSSVAHPSVPTQSATSQSLTCNVAERSAAWINVHTRQRLKFYAEVANTYLCIAQRTKSSLKVTESFRDNTEKSETFVWHCMHSLWQLALLHSSKHYYKASVLLQNCRSRSERKRSTMALWRPMSMVSGVPYVTLTGMIKTQTSLVDRWTSTGAWLLGVSKRCERKITSSMK